MYTLPVTEKDGTDVISADSVALPMSPESVIQAIQAPAPAEEIVPVEDRLNNQPAAPIVIAIAPASQISTVEALKPIDSGEPAAEEKLFFPFLTFR